MFTCGQMFINAVGVAGFILCYSVFDGMKVDGDVSTAMFLIEDYNRRWTVDTGHWTVS